MNRNLVSGLIGTILGSIWTLRAIVEGLRGDLVEGSGAYADGQAFAVIFGGVFFMAGLYYLKKGLAERNSSDG